MRKKKIIRVIARLNVGGPAIHVILLTAGLDPERYESLLVSGKEAPEEGNMLHLAEEKGIQPRIVPNLGRELQPLRDLKTLWQLYRIFRSEKPDIVHTHTAKAGTVGRLAAWLAGVPIIIHTFHGHVLQGYFGPLKTRMFQWIERGLARITTRIIAVSEQCNRDLLAFGIGSPEKNLQIPLGLELDRFAHQSPSVREQLRHELGLPPNAFVISIIARMVPIKRHKLLLEAIPLTLSAYPDAWFLFVGDGELRPALEQRRRELGIESRCLFCGFRDDRERFYAASDLIVLTSRNEGLPVVIIEAFASGTPVVATRVGGVPELVADGVTGFLVEPEDPTALAEGLKRALADPAKTAAMGQAAQAKTLQSYSIDRLLGDLDRLYRQLSP